MRNYSDVLLSNYFTGIKNAVWISDFLLGKCSDELFDCFIVGLESLQHFNYACEIVHST